MLLQTSFKTARFKYLHIKYTHDGAWPTNTSRGCIIQKQTSGHNPVLIPPWVINNPCTRWVAGSDAIFKGFHTLDNRYEQVG